MEFAWIVRKPIPVTTIDNIIKVFPSTVWLALFISLASIGMCFAAFYHIYQTKYFRDAKLVRENVPNFDFALLTFASLMEPDPLPWFDKYSAGRIENQWNMYSKYLEILLFFV